MRIQQDPVAEQEILVGLQIAARKLETAKHYRKAMIALARAEGLTNASIGRELGVTEAAVRSLAKRGA